MITLTQNVVRQLVRVQACKMAVLLTLVGSCLLGQFGVANAAVLDGSEPDPTFNGNSMQLWLRADAGVTASTTFTWADQSTHGNDASQSGATTRPTYVTSGPGTIGGLPAVDFDGSNDSLLGSLSSNLVSDSFTGFVVYHTPDALVTNSFHPFDSDDGGNRFGFASYISTVQEYFLNFDSQATSGVPLNVNPILMSTVGTPVSTNTIAQDLNGSNILTSSFAATNTINGYRIGSRFDGAGGLMDGSIAELIIYDEVLSSEDYNAVGFYLQDKYGLAGAFTAPLVEIAAVPEPSGLALVLLGGSALMLRRRSENSQAAQLQATEL